MFLCTGNSCRSQMAEGFARALGGKDLEVSSAGLQPCGLNPKAVAVMREVGIDISQQTSDEIDMGLLEQMDYGITLCGDAEERCPLTPPNVQRLHWPFDDLAKATGSPEEVMQEFRRVRDGIRAKIEAFVAEVRSQ
jgi:arsenate reductase